MIILIWGAMGILVVLALLLLWYMIDKRFRVPTTEDEVKLLTDQVRALQEERSELKRRIEHLEAIATADGRD